MQGCVVDLMSFIYYNPAHNQQVAIPPRIKPNGRKEFVMTKEEIDDCITKIIGWIKEQQVNMPTVYIGTIGVFDEDLLGDSDFLQIIICNTKGLRVWFANDADTVHNYEHKEPWYWAKLPLRYKVALVKQWPKVKSDILEKIKERVSDIEFAAKRESELCAKVTEFTL